MNAKAVDILGRVPPLDLAAYDYVEVNGIKIEIRDLVLTIRNPNGGLLIRPVVSNTIEITPGERR